MSYVKAAALLVALGVLCVLANASYAADSPPTLKHYAFELATLNSVDKVSKGAMSFDCNAVQFDIAATTSDDELAFGNNLLNDLPGRPADDEGYRNFTMSNGTSVRVGAIRENEDVNGAAVPSLPVEL